MLEPGAKTEFAAGTVVNVATGKAVVTRFRLKDPDDIEEMAERIRAAGGIITDKGEFCPGEPYLYCSDPDGYVLEIWYELPTPVDPKR